MDTKPMEAKRMKTFTAADADGLCQSARTSPRQRAHHNLHPTLDAPVQRLCIALQPETYVRPHCHSEPNKWEQLVVLEGAVSVLICSPEGQLLERIELSASGTRMLEVPAFTWHTLICQAPDSLVFEIKEGPYAPSSDKDFAPWAPAEGTQDAARFREWWRGLTVGGWMVPPTNEYGL